MASEACGSMIRNRCERDGHEFSHTAFLMTVSDETFLTFLEFASSDVVISLQKYFIIYLMEMAFYVPEFDSAIPRPRKEILFTDPYQHCPQIFTFPPPAYSTGMLISP
jgi:hypothetical protein